MPAAQATIGFWTAYGLVSLGVLVSVLLPILRGKLPNPVAQVPRAGLRAYWVIGGISAATALIVLAINNGEFQSPYAALLAGYAWDSTLQKVL